jgi:hypothetical protein
MVMGEWQGPTMVGGDFNLVRDQTKKSNGVICFNQANMFNDWINSWGLMEIKDPCKTFTWTNNQDMPILAVLDRILVSIDSDAKYQLARVVMLPKGVSDHNPFKITFGERNQIRDPLFKFEKWWIEMEDFDEIVKKAWSVEYPLRDPVDIWQFKIMLLWKKIKGWHRNREAELKREKAQLLADLDLLDSLVEQEPLTAQDKSRRKEMKEKLEHHWKLEEMKARQRSRDREIKEGHKNTSYIFTKVNQRKRSKAITHLECDGETFNDTPNMINHAKDLYKKMFGFEPRSEISLSEDFRNIDEMVSLEDRKMLEFEFSKEEIKRAIDGSYVEGAPGHYGFSFLFYQRFWQLIKSDFMAMVKKFEKGR